MAHLNHPVPAYMETTPGNFLNFFLNILFLCDGGKVRSSAKRKAWSRNKCADYVLFNFYDISEVRLAMISS